MRRATLLVLSIIVVMGLLKGLTYVNEARTSQKTNLAEIYIMALEEIINLDEDLHNDKKYFALDTDTLEGLDDIKIQEVLNSLQKKYKMEVVEASYSDLLDQGREERGKEISCLILYIEKVENYIVRIKVHVGKEYGPLGGNGIILDIRFDKGKWKIYNLRHNWIA